MNIIILKEMLKICNFVKWNSNQGAEPTLVFLFSADNESPLKVGCRTNDFLSFSLFFFAMEEVGYFSAADMYMNNYANDVVYKSISIQIL